MNKKKHLTKEGLAQIVKKIQVLTQKELILKKKIK